MKLSLRSASRPGRGASNSTAVCRRRSKGRAALARSLLCWTMVSRGRARRTSTTWPGRTAAGECSTRTTSWGPPGEVDAVEGYLMAFRRDLLSEIGLLDEKYRFYRHLDLDLSFAARTKG